jgi:2-polyprenyl-6-methoxyphenol hydroxylase-like FAD-dependent oxidoreductase
MIGAAETDDFELQVWPSYTVDKLKHWHTSRMVLIGDAAHGEHLSSQMCEWADCFSIATPPHGGQGASQSLEDAAYLSHLLRQLLSSKSDAPTTDELSSVFSQFQDGRQPRVNAIIAGGKRLGDGKRELSPIGMFFKKWGMKIYFTFFMKENWLDAWFAYEVPGIEGWS